MLGKIGRALLVLIPLVLLVLLALRLLHPLPDPAGREASSAIPASDRTVLGAAVLPLAVDHPGTSGIYPLGNGVDAFAARVALARAADVSIDAQYYIWADDLTGIRLLAELQDAANRGVRVRLLVDDNGTPALDQELVALDALPTAEVRYFNPFMMRSPRVLNYAFDFFRLNRRMHNKSFTVDGAVTIVGGRNIGDVYFETGAGHLYFDLDVLAAGPAATAVGADFDRYWNSASAFPAAMLITAGADAADRLAERDAVVDLSPGGRLCGGGARYDAGPSDRKRHTVLRLGARDTVQRRPRQGAGSGGGQGPDDPQADGRDRRAGAFRRSRLGLFHSG